MYGNLFFFLSFLVSTVYFDTENPTLRVGERMGCLLFLYPDPENRRGKIPDPARWEGRTPLCPYPFCLD